MSSNSNWGGPRPGSGRPLNPLTPLQAMERAAELVSKTIKVLGSTAMKDDDTLDLPEGAKYCMMDLMSVADKLEETISSEKVRKMRDIIEASEYMTVTAEYNGMYTVVDGSLLDGTYSIKTGTQGMPVSEYQEVSSIEAAIKIIQEKGLLDQEWESVGEDE